MLTRRRSFLGMMAGASVVPSLFAQADTRIRQLKQASELGKRLPGWQPGELELHFIHTGRGENMFYIFPDGTTMVNDTGDNYRPHEVAEIPWMPRADLLGGECVARYIKSIWQQKHLDYMIVSHWHSDHVGAPDLSTITAADGRKVCGLALLGEHFSFGQFFDHQFPEHGKYNQGDKGSREMMVEFVKAKNIAQQPFRVGALNQLKLQHDTVGKYNQLFSIRNVCANAVCWSGKGDETVDYGAIHERVKGAGTLRNQNTLSMGFVIQYGNFRFWTGGDVSCNLSGEDGKPYNYEGVVGRSVGPVTVCKTNHHAFRDAMTREFVEQVKAAAYITAVWCPRHIQDNNMQFMSSRELYPGERMVFPTQVPQWPRTEWPTAQWWQDIAPGGHVVVKVAPGGEKYKIYLLDATNEELQVTHLWQGIATT